MCNCLNPTFSSSSSNGIAAHAGGILDQRTDYEGGDLVAAPHAAAVAMVSMERPERPIGRVRRGPTEERSSGICGNSTTSVTPSKQNPSPIFKRSCALWSSPSAYMWLIISVSAMRLLCLAYLCSSKGFALPVSVSQV